MKKIIIAIFLVVGVFTTPVFAKEKAFAQVDIVEEITNQEVVETTSEPITLSEEIKVSENSSDISFLSILFATITPALLLAVGYLLIKMSSK